MFEIHVTISCPDLVEAARLLKGLSTDSTAAAKAAPVAAPAPQPTVAAPVTPSVPLAQAPTFTQADIAKAGADLFTARPDLQPQVMALLSQYGCQSVMDLKPEHFGAFATALRGMGAKI